MTWTQVYDPLGHWWLSTLVAALPVIVLLGALALLRLKAHWAALLGLAASEHHYRARGHAAAGRLDEMRKEGVTTVTCEFCNQSYLFDEADLDRIRAA